MAKLKFIKVVGTLPTGSDIKKDTIVALRTGSGFDLYISDNTASILHKINDVLTPAKLQSILTDISNSKSSITTITNRLDTLDVNLNAKFTNLDDSIGEIESDVSSNSAKLTTVQRVVQTFSTMIEAIREDITELTEKFTTKNKKQILETNYFSIDGATTLFSRTADTDDTYVVTTPFKKNDTSMVEFTISGTSYDGDIIESKIFLYNYTNGFPYNPRTKQIVGSLLESGVWLGYDDNNNLTLMFGGGFPKYYLSADINVRCWHGGSNLEQIFKNAIDKANWNVDMVVGNPTAGATATFGGNVYTRLTNVPTEPKTYLSTHQMNGRVRFTGVATNYWFYSHSKSYGQYVNMTSRVGDKNGEPKMTWSMRGVPTRKGQKLKSIVCNFSSAVAELTEVEMAIVISRPKPEHSLNMGVASNSYMDTPITILRTNLFNNTTGGDEDYVTTLTTKARFRRTFRPTLDYTCTGEENIIILFKDISASPITATRYMYLDAILEFSHLVVD